MTRVIAHRGYSAKYPEMSRDAYLHASQARGLACSGGRAKVNVRALAKGVALRHVQPPFYVPVLCGFTKHVSGTGGRMPRA